MKYAKAERLPSKRIGYFLLNGILTQPTGKSQIGGPI